ncbi:unnamed protein product [Durusdinium trenchii]|uniref:Uncharacterized protein n=1 Tax=Durusdinium trenchii TaxID=1381693 RepID=A0ABP0NK80_9DINO
MDETLLGWIFLIGVMIWRMLLRCHCSQRLLHMCGPVAWMFQWYYLTFAFLVLLLVRTFYDIVKYDYIGFHFLSDASWPSWDKIYNQIEKICDAKSLSDDACDALRKELRIPPWLHKFSLVAPVCGLLGFAILSMRLGYFVKKNADVKLKVKQGEQAFPDDDEGHEVQVATDGMPWKLADRMDWVVIILGTPLIFIVMSMRSLIRIWTVMTGTAFRGDRSWEEMSRLEIATYQMDLELAVGFQFYACLMFGLLCTSFLQHSRMVSIRDTQYSAKRYMRIVAYTAVQGVYAFVFIGVLRTIFDIAVTYISEMPKYHEQAQIIQDKVLGKVATIFSFVTLLCMLNMFLISRVPDIARGLNGANPKFTSVRLLLLIAQIQPTVLQAITVGSPLYKNVSENVAKFHLEDMFQKWTFTEKQALLAHAAALNVECLVVACLTWLLWRPDDKRDKELMKDLAAEDKVAQAREIEDAYQLLLDA